MPVRRMLAPVLAIALLTGCPGVINVVVPPTGAEKSPAPKDAKATPKPTGTASPGGDACAAPKGAPSGSAKLGAFAGKALTPELSKLTSEAAVRAAIAKLQEDKAAWACFQRNYPAATVAFLGEPEPVVTPGIGLPSAMPVRPGLPDPALAALCAADAPAAQLAVFGARHGRYNGQKGPNGWDNLADEKTVTEAIDKFKAYAAGGAADKVNQWSCMNKFYPGLLTVYAASQAEPRPSVTLAPLMCSREAPPGTPGVGTSRHGAYNGQRLPDGWTALSDEAAVTDTIRKLDGGADWACFQKFFGGAYTVYLGRSGAPVATPEPPAAPGCRRESPSAPPATGSARHGAYNGQLLPNGWDNLADEAAITEAIRKMDGGADWACFQKFFAGAVTIYLAKK